MIGRSARRVARVLRGRGAASDPPAVPALTYREPGNQWYRPVLAGPSSLVSHVAGGNAVRAAMAVLERLDADDYHRHVINFYRAGLDRLGDAWSYADLYTVLRGLSHVLQPASYLEIGVRRGHSMAMVASQAPGCDMYGFDLWVENYAGSDNPGEGFVRSQLASLPHRGAASFVGGDSARTVPSFLAVRPDLYFDLVTVDGDHSARGARRDLQHVLPRVKLGGAVVFDDLINPSHPRLRQVWRDVVCRDARFAPWAFEEAGFGVAFALRCC